MMIEQSDNDNREQGYGAFLRQTFDHPMVERFQKSKTRRILVLLMCAWYLIVNVMACSFPGAIWVWGLLFLAFFPLASAINMSVRGVTEIPFKDLDDRQANLKSRAYMNAYWLGICLAIIFGFAVATVGFADLHILPFLAGGAGLLVGLPAMLLAWKLPDETDDEV